MTGTRLLLMIAFGCRIYLALGGRSFCGLRILLVAFGPARYVVRTLFSVLRLVLMVFLAMFN